MVLPADCGRLSKDGRLVYLRCFEERGRAPVELIIPISQSMGIYTLYNIVYNVIMIYTVIEMYGREYGVILSY